MFCLHLVLNSSQSVIITFQIHQVLKPLRSYSINITLQIQQFLNSLSIEYTTLQIYRLLYQAHYRNTYLTTIYLSLFILYVLHLTC